MKQHIKIISLLLVAFLLISFVIIPANAIEEPTITVSSTEGAVGSTVDIDIGLVNNPGILNAQLTVDYNSAVLELVAVNDTGILPGKLHTSAFNSPYTLTWINGTATEDYTVVGTIVTLRFRIKEAASIGGVYNIVISYDYDNYEIHNFNFEPIAFSIQNGAITVVCPHTNTTDVPETPAKCNEKGYTAGVYCNDCETYISGHEEITATGNHVDADGEWEIDVDNHYHTCECGKIIDSATHAGGTATCVNKAVCSTCGVEYGTIDSNKHGKTEIRDVSEETCAKDGYTGDTYCKDCGEKIANGTVIPATGNHVDVDGKWEHDEDTHFRTCICGHTFDSAAHSGGTATCTEKAICLTCGVEYGTVDNTKHGETEIRDVSEETCAKDGYTGDTYCKDCGEKIANGTVIPATGNHVDADGKWETATDNHYHTCECGKIIDSAAHAGGTATCVDKAVCAVCGVEYGTVDSTKHGETEIRDVSEETCAKDGYTGDTYCKDCGEKIANGAVIPATGNHVDADGKWETATDNHYHTCECGEIIDSAAHAGGTATCVDKAVCSVCGVEYGTVDSTKHGETEIRDASEETCAKDGYTGDTYCKDCGEKIATGIVIPATDNHVDADGKWETATDNHYHTCECGEIIDSAAHAGGTATCVDKAVCSVCGVEYGTVDNTKHGEAEIRDVSEETCAKDGYTGDTYCKDCGEKIATGIVIPATGNHVDADGEWETATDNHYHTCECGEIIDSAAHAGGTATCVDKAVCAVCGVEYGTVDSTKHGETEIRDASKETCTDDGYTGDTYCKDCAEKIAAGIVIPATGNHVDADGKWETDADNHYHTCSCREILNASAHEYGDWVVTKEPAVGITGLREKSCSVCEHTATEEIPALEETPDQEEPPVTGESTSWVVAIILVLIGSAAILFLTKKKEREE